MYAFDSIAYKRMHFKGIHTCAWYNLYNAQKEDGSCHSNLGDILCTYTKD